MNNREDFAEAVTLVAVTRRHTAFTTEQMIDAGVAEQIIDLYVSLLEVAKGHEIGEAKSKRSSEAKDHALDGADSQLKTSVPESEGIRQELASRRGAETRHQEEVARYQTTIDSLRQELVAKSVKAAADLNRRDGRIEELQKAYSHLDKLLHGEQEQRTTLLTELERVRRESWDQLEAGRQQLNAVDQQLKDYRQQDEAARRQLARHEEALRQAEQRQRKAHQQSERDKQELAQLRERFAQTNELLQNTGIRLADFESRNSSLTDRLRKQLQEMKRLLRLLDQVDQAADLLRHSRRWKLANPFAALLTPFTGKQLPGFGHLDKNVLKYRAWKESHPEVDSLVDEIQALRPREILSSAVVSESASAPPTETTSTLKPPLPKKPVSFVARDEVEISIIIPVYNQVDFTHSCLAAVQEHSGDVSYEVIIADDASTDATSEVIRAIPGLLYLRAENNAGFIAACNRGAAAARGRYLVFLNNDTTVTAGWLDALRETFTFESTAGLVGSKLVYPDGRLQEAGGIIWRDGSGWNRGKFQNPTKPEYNYLREVDYCSAASVMIPKSLFDQVGGFDQKYAPAYYEDTDLAFKVRESGRKVLYQPLSVVVHYEGVTAGTDTSVGTKRYQNINRGTFVTTWAKVLSNKPENGNVVAHEALPPGKKRILVIDHHLPMPDRDSGSLRMFQILTILHGLGHHVTFLPDNLADIPPYADALRKRGVEVIYHPHFKSVRDYLKSHGAQLDVIILSRCDFARKHIAETRTHAPQARVIFDTVDLHFLREARQAEMIGDPELQHKADEKRQLEYDLIDQADETWVVSPAERDLLRSARPDSSIEVVSNIVDIPGSAAPFSHRRDILFIGSFQHPPNIDAVLFFTQRIFPMVAERLPGVRFYIIGDKAPPEVLALAGTNVIVTGFQPDVSAFFNSIKLSVAPLRYGAGVKGKINQSMGFGVPVVATPVAAEGMSLLDGEEIVIAEEPIDFAERLVDLYLTEEIWQRISRQSIVKTRELFSVDTASRQLEKILRSEPDGDGASHLAPGGGLREPVTV
ncbi:MAG: glycosyltransferase [Spartobacteria bacterium]